MFRPCIDLHDGKVKQIIGSTLESGKLKTNFIAKQNASDYAALFRKDQLTGGHVIMLGPGNEEEAVKALETYPGGLQIGGGIHSGNVSFFLDAGASHVIVTSWLFINNRLSMERLCALSKQIGPKRLIIDLSCKKKKGEYRVAINRWNTETETILSDSLIESLSPFCDEFLIHAADVEGKCLGMDEDLLSSLGKWSHHSVITYAGGANSLEDLERVEKIGKGRVHLTIGSALDIFGGTLIRYQDAVAFNKQIKSEKQKCP